MAIISRGNSKVGKIPNISFPPVVACGEAANFCGADCYAIKAYHQYPNVRAAWDHNLEQAKNDMESYFAAIYQRLSRMRSRFFRWHVSGDFISFNYFAETVKVAKAFPHIKFLAFTKQYKIVNLYLTDTTGSVVYYIPDNYQIVFSAWPKLEMHNPYQFPVAFMNDGTEDRLTGLEIECPGNCESCGMCWSLNKVSRNVVFNKH